MNMGPSGLLLCCAAALLACSGMKEASGKTASNSDSQAVRVVQEYVATRKGWRASDYRIEGHGHKNGLVVYFIIYLPEERSAPGERKALIAGGGRSFAVYYDPVKRRVVKEMHFQ